MVLVDNLHGQQHLLYNYSLDLSPTPAANHCIKLLVHFGTPRTCAYDVLVSTGPGVAVSSATKAAFGDITLLFSGGCLSPSLLVAPFGMISDTPPKTNFVTVIDDYVDPASGQTNEARVNVTAVVPDIPPNWAYAPQPLPNTFFQGFINSYTNSVPMKTAPSSGLRPVHQEVAAPIQFQSAGQSIQIEFTDQQLSPHAGTAPCWAFLQRSGWIGLLERGLPHPRPQSNHHLTPVSKVLGFVQGLLRGAKKFTQLAYLRRDPLVPEMLGIKRVASQSVLSRFFLGFASAGRNLACFRRRFAWCLERLPSRPGGYALALDSTRLLHEDGHQEGVVVGCSRLGTKPCLHPLLAVLSEVRLAAALRLRPGRAYPPLRQVEPTG